MSSIVCPKCNTVISNPSNFCPNCGLAIYAVSQPSAYQPFMIRPQKKKSSPLSVVALALLFFLPPVAVILSIIDLLSKNDMYTHLYSYFIFFLGFAFTIFIVLMLNGLI